jgi:hypothetical protein
MEDVSSDKGVPREISALLTGEQAKLRGTERTVTPFAGMAVLIEHLNRIDLMGALRQHMPVRYLSRSQIDPSTSLVCFLVSVLGGARRFAHASWLRGDKALHAMLGVNRFPTDDTHLQPASSLHDGSCAASVEPLKCCGCRCAMTTTVSIWIQPSWSATESSSRAQRCDRG